MAPIIPFTPCTAPAHNHNSKVWPLCMGARLPHSTGRRRPVSNSGAFPCLHCFEATALVVPFEKLRMSDVEAVGGKNASLGEMISQRPRACVPTGFATTAHAFREFLAHEGLAERISARLATLDVDDVRALAAAGAEIAAGWRRSPSPGSGKICATAFAELSARQCQASFAVRLRHGRGLPDASFAGQQETFLNVVGIEDVLHKMKEVFASPTTTAPSATALRAFARRGGAVGRRAAHGALGLVPPA